MDESRSENPWASRDVLSGVNLGTPHSALVQARRCGLLSGDELNRTTAKSPSSHGEGAADRPGLLISGNVCDCRSTRLTSLLRELAAVREKIDEVELETLKYLLDKETADITHSEVLESHLNMIDGLLSHFTSIIDAKQQLLSRLQSQTAESSLAIEAPYQKHMAELIPAMGMAITELPKHYQQLQWAGQLDLPDTALEDREGRTVQSLVQCWAAYQLCLQLHQLQSDHL